MSSNGRLLEVKTVQAAAFKTLIESLKDVLLDCAFEFDDAGLKLIALDTSHVVLVHLRLDADKFETYTCLRQLHVGVNMIKLFTLVKTVSNNDTLTLFIDETDINHLGIRIESPDTNRRTTYLFNILDLDAVKIDVPSVDFSTSVTMDSGVLLKLVRDMHSHAEKVSISALNNCLYFKCIGDFSTQETVLGPSSGMTITTTGGDGAASEGTIVQGTFPLKYLQLFTRCTNLSPTVELFLANNFPICVRYGVAGLGHIKMLLAPLADE